MYDFRKWQPTKTGNTDGARRMADTNPIEWQDDPCVCYPRKVSLQHAGWRRVEKGKGHSLKEIPPKEENIQMKQAQLSV